MKLYSEAAMERAMKIQEVILRALAKKINWWQAAEIIGISDRQMRRWRQRYEEYGYDGLYDRRRGKPSPRRVPVGTVEKVLELYRETYRDFNVRHFREKLLEQHGIRLSYTWVKLALQGAGLIARGGSEASIASGDRDVRSQGCCCMWTGAVTAGFRMSAGMTCWWSWTMPIARYITRSWWRKNPPAR